MSDRNILVQSARACVFGYVPIHYIVYLGDDLMEYCTLAILFLHTLSL